MDNSETYTTNNVHKKSTTLTEDNLHEDLFFYFELLYPAMILTHLVCAILAAKNGNPEKAAADADSKKKAGDGA